MNDVINSSKPRSKRRLIFLAAIGIGILATGIFTSRMWAWRVAALREGPLSGPWRIPEGAITVMTYNIQFGDRLDEALRLILQQAPDIVCLQEIKPSQISHIKDVLQMDGHWAPSSNLLGDAAWGNAVFSRGRLSQVQRLTTQDGGAFGVWAVVEMDEGRFVIASVHLMHVKRKDGGIRARLRETSALLTAYSALDAPTIIAGDFNEPPIGAVYPIMTGTLTDAAPNSGPTLPAKFPITRVDYIFASDHWSSASGEAISSSISDHRPVIATLKPRNSQPEPFPTTSSSR